MSCLSPTLPLPPPAEPDVSGPTEQGLVTLSGTVSQPEATVLALNRETEQIAGVFADQRGAYVISMAAQAGDAMELWWEFGNQESSHATFRIKSPAPVRPTMTGPDASGQVTLSGNVPLPGARVYVRDRRTGGIQSAAADASGAYQLTIAAAAGDSLELWYLGGAGESQHLTVVVGST